MEIHRPRRGVALKHGAAQRARRRQCAAAKLVTTRAAACTGAPPRDRARPKGWSAVAERDGKMDIAQPPKKPNVSGPQPKAGEYGRSCVTWSCCCALFVDLLPSETRRPPSELTAAYCCDHRFLNISRFGCIQSMRMLASALSLNAVYFRARKRATRWTESSWPHRRHAQVILREIGMGVCVLPGKPCGCTPSPAYAKSDRAQGQDFRGMLAD